MSVRNDPSVQSGGTSLLSGALLIGAAETAEVSKPGARRQTLEQVTQAPVTFIPETDSQNPVSAKPRHTFAQTVGNFFRRMIRPAAAVALGATLLLAGGCASVRQGGLHPAGVPVAQGSVRIADDQVKISDFDVRLRIQNMNRSIMNSGTPAMGMITRSDHVRQTVGGDYKKNIIPEFVVEKAANGKFVAVFLLPVSGHVGDTRAEQQENARHYGEIDRHKIWIKYPDGSTKVLAQNLDPKGDLTYAIRLEIELPKGKSEIIFSPLPDGRPELTCHDHRWPVDPDGFGPGRRQIYNVE
jgi:hypothetical protein